MSQVMALGEYKQNYKSTLEPRIAELENITTSLLAQLKECERQCKQHHEGEEITIGDPVPLPGMPFEWAGPFPAVCDKCIKLADTLNLVPEKALKAASDLAAAKAALEMLENSLKLIRDGHVDMEHIYLLDKLKSAKDSKEIEDIKRKIEKAQKYSKKEALKAINEYEQKIRRQEKHVAKMERALEKIRKAYEMDLAAYNDCIKQCGPEKSTEKDNSLHITNRQCPIHRNRPEFRIRLQCRYKRQVGKPGQGRSYGGVKLCPWWLRHIPWRRQKRQRA